MSLYSRECRFCGCTDNVACDGGCRWATASEILSAGLNPEKGDVCTRCLEDHPIRNDFLTIWPTIAIFGVLLVIGLFAWYHFYAPCSLHERLDTTYQLPARCEQ